MSGTNPLFRLERVFGEDLFGDDQARLLNRVLTELSEDLAAGGARLEDVVAELVDAADQAGLDLDEALRRAREAAEDLLDGDDGAGDDGDDGGGADGGNGGDGGNGDGAAGQSAFALLLPANNSGALAFAAAQIQGTTLNVQFIADNVTPGQPHPLHIHGFTDGRAERLATVADDADGDGFVETAEGAAAAFGPVLASLTASGEVDPALAGSADFTAADAAGRIVFIRSYQLDPAEADDQDVLTALQARLEGRVVKLHGIEVEEGAGEGTPGEVGGEGGYAALLPVAAGQFLALPEAVNAALTGQIQSDPGALGGAITGLLDALAPFTLKVDGSGPIAPDPFLAAEDGDDGAEANGAGVQEFVTLILPSNNSGVFGAARIAFDAAAGSVAVDLDLGGLEPGQAHAMHIHGFTDDLASLIPNITLDADLDGFVEASEGASVIGPVLLGLTEDGSVTDAALVGDWPVADANGHVSLEQTYRFDLADPAEATLFGELRDRMEGRQIQVHGLTTEDGQGEGTRGEVDGEGGWQPLLAVAHGAILSTDTPGAELAVTLAGLVQGSLEAEAAAAAAAGGAALPEAALIG